MIVGCLRHATEGSVLRVPSSLIDDLVRQCAELVLPCPPSELPELPSLAVALGAVPDSRRRRGRRYRLSAIVQWARDADEATLAALGAPARQRPAATTIIRAFERVDPDALDDACFGWINALLTDTRPNTAKVTGLAWTARPRAARRTPTARPRTWSPPCATTPPPSPDNAWSRRKQTRSRRSPRS